MIVIECRVGTARLFGLGAEVIACLAPGDCSVVDFQFGPAADLSSRHSFGQSSGCRTRAHDDACRG